MCFKNIIAYIWTLEAETNVAVYFCDSEVIFVLWK